MVPCNVGHRAYTNESQYMAAVAATLPCHLTRPFCVSHRKKYTGDQTSEGGDGGGGGGDGDRGGAGGDHHGTGPEIERRWKRGSHLIENIIAEALTADKTANITTTATAHQLWQTMTTSTAAPAAATTTTTATTTTETADGTSLPCSKLHEAKQAFQQATTSSGDSISNSRRASIQDGAQSRLPVKKRHLYLATEAPVPQVSCATSTTPVAQYKQEPTHERHQPLSIDDGPTKTTNGGLDGHHLAGPNGSNEMEPTFWRADQAWHRFDAQQQYHPTAPSIILPVSLQYIPFGLYVAAAAAAAAAAATSAATGMSYCEHQEALRSANSLGGLSQPLETQSNATHHTNNYHHSHHHHHHHTPVPQSTASRTATNLAALPAATTTATPTTITALKSTPNSASSNCKTGAISANNTTTSTMAGTTTSRPFREDPSQDYIYIPGRGRGKWVCMKCGIRCKKPSMLKKHFRTHTNVRPFFCRQCGCAFKTRGNLTKHMKSKSHFKRCQDLGIFNVPTKIDNRSQIDTIALAIQKNIEL